MPAVAVQEPKPTGRSPIHHPLTAGIAAKIGSRVEGPPGSNGTRKTTIPHGHPSKVPKHTGRTTACAVRRGHRIHF